MQMLVQKRAVIQLTENNQNEVVQLAPDNLKDDSTPWVGNVPPTR